jgi:hypothetical protein
MTVPNAELPHAGSIPIDLEVKYNDGLKLSGLYFLPFSIAASISFVWNTFPILPRYFRLNSRSNEGDCFAFQHIMRNIFYFIFCTVPQISHNPAVSVVGQISIIYTSRSGTFLIFSWLSSVFHMSSTRFVPILFSQKF